MLEFLQSYGVWILLGGTFLFLMSRGGGCGMGRSQDPGHDHQGQGRDIGSRSAGGQARLDNTAGRPTGDSANPENGKTPVGAHSGGCH